MLVLPKMEKNFFVHTNFCLVRFWLRKVHFSSSLYSFFAFFLFWLDPPSTRLAPVCVCVCVHLPKHTQSSSPKLLCLTHTNSAHAQPTDWPSFYFRPVNQYLLLHFLFPSVLDIEIFFVFVLFASCRWFKKAFPSDHHRKIERRSSMTTTTTSAHTCFCLLSSFSRKTFSFFIHSCQTFCFVLVGSWTFFAANQAQHCIGQVWESCWGVGGQSDTKTYFLNFLKWKLYSDYNSQTHTVFVLVVSLCTHPHCDDGQSFEMDQFLLFFPISYGHLPFFSSLGSWPGLMPIFGQLFFSFSSSSN